MTASSSPRGSAREVGAAFLKLGLTSFGGPIAHLGYFRREFVERRRWLDEARFAQLLAVCQLLPGPASSQMGFAIGLFRAGWLGAIAAFVGFTLPSALLMFVFAELMPRLDSGIGASIVHGLKLVAVVVVAQGLLGMVRQLTPDLPRVAIAAGAVAVVVMIGGTFAQLIAIGLGGALGIWLCRRAPAPLANAFPVRYGYGAALAFLAVFLCGLVIALLIPRSSIPTPAGLAAAFYQTGAFVFGGGHVVLPLLQRSVVDTGWIEPDTFLAGYGAAQAIPGPMFSLAVFLGAKAPTGMPSINAGIAMFSIFLPGFLLLLAALPVWQRLSQQKWAAGAIAGVNASVVGLLAAAFCNPVLVQGIRAPVDLVIALVGFALLTVVRVSSLWIVAWCVIASIVIGVV